MLTKTSTTLLQKAHWLGARIGHTPLVELKQLNKKKGVALWVKQEWNQLSGSVKCRAAYRIILQALESGELHADKALLDATSGNTGIAYATIGAAIGLKVVLCLPENASEERKQILHSLGAEIIYTSKFEGTDGAQEEAKALARQHPDRYYYADQYRNEHNWKAHYHGTAVELFTELPGITHFVAGLGTTGTFVGTSRRLKELNPAIEAVALQPDSAMHGLEGWKHLETALVPGIFDPFLASRELEVSTEEAYALIRRARREEDLLLSPSSAANIAGALKVVEAVERGVVVTVLPDNADKYGEVMKKLGL